MHPQQNIPQHKTNPKKLKTGLVASYDIRPENETGCSGRSRQLSQEVKN